LIIQTYPLTPSLKGRGKSSCPSDKGFSPDKMIFVLQLVVGVSTIFFISCCEKFDFSVISDLLPEGKGKE